MVVCRALCKGRWQKKVVQEFELHLLLEDKTRSNWMIAKKKHARNQLFVWQSPRGPNAEGLASHFPSHEPYRTWCPSCVAGRSVSNSHRFEPLDESVVPVVGLDCGNLAPRVNLTRLVRLFFFCERVRGRSKLRQDQWLMQLTVILDPQHLWLLGWHTGRR